jgi:hypothetical protein
MSYATHYHVLKLGCQTQKSGAVGTMGSEEQGRPKDLRRLHQAGQLPDGTDPDALAVTLLATLQGGLLLAQVQRDTRPLETAVDTLLQLARSSRPDVPEGSGVPAS